MIVSTHVLLTLQHRPYSCSIAAGTPDTPTVHSCPFCFTTANITKTVSRETLHSFPPTFCIPAHSTSGGSKISEEEQAVWMLSHTFFFLTPLWSAARGKIYITERRLLSGIIRLNVFVIVIAAITAQLCTFVMNAVSEIYDR